MSNFKLMCEYTRELIKESPLLLKTLPPNQELEKMSTDMGFNIITTESKVKKQPKVDTYKEYDIYRSISGDYYTDMYVNGDLTYFIFTYMLQPDNGISINLVLKFYYGSTFNLRVTDVLFDYYFSKYSYINTDNTETIQGKKLTKNLITDALHKGYNVFAVNNTKQSIKIDQNSNIEQYWGNVATDKYDWSFKITK